VLLKGNADFIIQGVLQVTAFPGLVLGGSVYVDIGRQLEIISGGVTFRSGYEHIEKVEVGEKSHGWFWLPVLWGGSSDDSGPIPVSGTYNSAITSLVPVKPWDTVVFKASFGVTPGVGGGWANADFSSGANSVACPRIQFEVWSSPRVPDTNPGANQ
jgi:hypothetical protein